MRRRDHGFTIVELLVVVTILALLLAILLPSMNRGRDAARRVVCASNERQIAVSALTYGGDNAGHLMLTYKATSGRDPAAISTDLKTPDGSWGVYQIQPYLNGFDVTTHRCQPIFTCPGSNADFWGWLSKASWESGWASSHHFTQLCYNYYAGVDRWTGGEARNGADRQICQLRPGGGDRVLLSDTLLPDGNGTPYFRYNHGVGGSWGWSFVSTGLSYEKSAGRAAGCRYDLAPPPISGLNQAFGDGSVRWKDAAQIKTNEMFNTASYHDGWVYRGPGSPAYY